MATKQDTEQARFDYVLPTVKAAEENGRKRVTATASSDEPDLSGDVMSLKALQQLRDAFSRGMTIFLNHSYRVPDDVAGRVVSAEIVRRDGFNDLDLVIEIDQSNPRALAAYDQIKGGVTLGVSIGILVREVKAVTVNGKKATQITDCEPLEASLCGIPSNRRSWVHAAMKSASFVLERRSEAPKIADGDAVVALRLLTRLQAARISILEREVEKHEAATNELCAQVNVLMKTPRGRKIAPDVAFDDLANKYPWLDSRIINELSRDQHATGARS